jgi:NTE family protein
MRSTQIIAMILAIFLAAGCSFYRVNPPLARNDLQPGYGYRYRNLAQTAPGNTERNFIIVTMSGGGTRAAAFAYGVIEEMNQSQIDPSGTTLLDEVDVISSVSGGSFAAAYLGLFGKQKFLEDFQHDVLERQIQRDLFLKIAAPWNWPDMMLYGRSDLAEQYYNEHIFGGHTFADLPRRRPYIILNATDLTMGSTFSFTQDYFDRICSDLRTIPVARGVLASSAFPVAFTPITLKNYGAGECRYREPGWVRAALQDFSTNPTRFHRADVWSSYKDSDARPFIHLSDGGLADNIGLRGPEVALTSTDSPWSVLNRKSVQRIAVIVVNAKTPNEAAIDKSSRRPMFTTVLDASASNPMANYSFDTIESLRLFVEEQQKAAQDYDTRRKYCGALAGKFCQTSNEGSCQQERQNQCYRVFNATDEFRPRIPEYYEIHVQFEAIKNPADRLSAESIPTSLELPKRDIELLKRVAREILDSSEQYQKLLSDLKADAKRSGK